MRITFKTKEEIPASILDQFEEKDGAWTQKADESETEAAGLRASLGEERTKREAAEKLAKKVAADLKTLETKGKASEAGITDEKLKEIRAEVEKEVMERLAPDLETGKKAVAENRSLKLDNQIKSAALKSGFLGEKVDDYWKLHGDEFDLTDDGKPMVKANPGMTVDKLIETHKSKRPEWVQGTKAGGGGAAGATTGGGSSSISAADMLANPVAALAAARAAGKTE